MNELIARVQKDLNKLQKSLEKEGEILLKKIRKTAAKAEDNVSHKKDEVAKLIQKQVKNFEPALEKFYKEIKTNAGKYGVDIDNLENRVKSTTQKAAAKLNLKKKKVSKKKSKKVTKKAKAKTKTKANSKAKTKATGAKKTVKKKSKKVTKKAN